MEKYGFSGCVVKYDVKNATGDIISKNTFKNIDGKIVPLIYNFQHYNSDSILGYAMLENKDDGIYCNGIFNDSPYSALCKEHNINGLGIYANNIERDGDCIKSGNIRYIFILPEDKKVHPDYKIEKWD